jgi:L-amino acid N-acyltransferase YncA
MILRSQDLIPVAILALQMHPVFHIAQESDLPKIVQTYNSTIPSRLSTADLEPVTVESKWAWFKAHDEKKPLWIIKCAGNYAGWMSFGKFYGRPAYDGVAELSVYLEKDFQAKGLGHICVKKAMEEAGARKIHTLLCFIFAHNAASIRLFEKHGFVRWGTLPEVAQMDQLRRDLVILGKKIL